MPTKRRHPADFHGQLPRRALYNWALPALFALLFALLPQATTRAYARQNAQDIQVEATAGFGDTGAYLIGEWVPVRVTLTNPPGGSARRVRVEVEAYGNDDRLVTGRYEREVDLPSQSRKEITLYTYTGAYTRAFHLNVFEGNTTLKSLQATGTAFEPPSNIIVGIASSDSSLLNSLANEKLGHIVGSLGPGMGQYAYPGANPANGQGASAVLAHLRLDDLPPSYQGWKGLGVLVLDDVDAGSLSPEQRAALETWVAEGGTLVVASRPGGGDSTGALSDLLPVAVNGTRDLDALDGLSNYAGGAFVPAGRSTVGNASPNPGTAESSRMLAIQDGTVLLASRDVGRGRVIYIGTSPALPPLKSWDGTVPLVKKLLADTVVRPSYGASTRFGPARGVYIGSLFGTYGAMFAMPGLDLPNAWLVGGFLLIYILIIGPLNFIVLRRMRRAELAWITVPALVGLFSVGAYLLAYQAKGGDVVSIRASAVNTYEDVPYATTTQNYGLFSPVRREYRLSMPAEAAVTELNAYGYYQAGSDSPSAVYGGDTTVIDNVLINTWSLKGFMTEHASKTESPLEADLRLENGMIVGSVRNRSSSPLQDVALLRGDAVQHIGLIAAGSSADVRLALSSSVFNNVSPAALLPAPPGVAAPQPGYSYPYNSANGAAEQRKYYRKIELLSAGLFPYIGDLPPTDMRVTLLAWGPSAPDPIIVERYTSQLEETTLWVSQATVRAGGQGQDPVAHGTAPYTIYAPGNSVPWLTTARSGGQYGVLAPGQAFPQAVPTTGPGQTVGTITIAPYAEVHYNLPPGTTARSMTLDYMFGAGPSGPVQVLAYNTNDGRWNELASIEASGTQTAVQVVVPDPAPYVGPAGDLTVRLVPGALDAALINPVFDIALNQGRP